MEDPDRAMGVLDRMKQTGASLAVDDFGTGYSSLAYLKRFPLDTVKIDRSFVRDLETDENDAAIAQAIVNLGHTLGLRVIAEGVETEGQLARLRDLGCDAIQGHYFSPAVPAEEFEAMLVAGKHL
jgi:EAL domain-containing protein (putative c-di-GMP-specific phosphodiesterase class I)